MLVYKRVAKGPHGTRDYRREMIAVLRIPDTAVVNFGPNKGKANQLEVVKFLSVKDGKPLKNVTKGYSSWDGKTVYEKGKIVRAEGGPFNPNQAMGVGIYFRRTLSAAKNG